MDKAFLEQYQAQYEQYQAYVNALADQTQAQGAQGAQGAQVPLLGTQRQKAPDIKVL